MPNRFAHKLVPALRALSGGFLVADTPERRAWVARMDRVKTGTLPTFVIGDIVTDGDMRSDHYGREFVVTAVNGDMLTLGDPKWGGRIVLGSVHRTFFDHAGRRWVDKTCPCPDYMRRSKDGVCSNHRCPAVWS